MQTKRSTRALDEQLRMEPFNRMAEGLRRKADTTLAKLQEAPNTLFLISTALGERFLSTLTAPGDCGRIGTGVSCC